MVVNVFKLIRPTNVNVHQASMVKIVDSMLVSVKHNNPVDNHQMLAANHSVCILLFHTSASLKMVMLMVLMLNKVYIYRCTTEGKLFFALILAEPSPCQGVDGKHALLVSEKGFIMCDDEYMFVESCPGGTIWDDVNKACTWPDMQTDAQLHQQQQDHPKQILTNTGQISIFSLFFILLNLLISWNILLSFF
jgi:hypothetical protein